MWILGLSIGLLGACGDDVFDEGPDAGSADVGTVDAGNADAGTDAGADGGSDAGPPDACATAVCDVNATCSSATGSAVCTCNDGFTGDGMTCAEELFCTDGVCGAGTCMEETEGYSCVCPEGFADDGTTCADVDECIDDAICGAGTCTNEDGGYTCTCPDGYADDGTTCVDIDECTDETDTCDDAAMCTNTDGAFTCECPDGFMGDGMTCEDIDECAMGTDTCDADTSTCLNEVGTFSCECNAGLSPDAAGVCTRGTVLILDDSSSDAASSAATTLGYTVLNTTTRATFQTAFDAGGFDLVIYDGSAAGLDADDATRLETWVAGGGKLIFGAFNFDDFASLQAALGVSATSFASPRPIHRANGALIDLYDQFDSFPNPFTTALDTDDNGDELTLVGEGQILASFDSASGPGAIVRTTEGRAIVNGFVVSEIGAADTDMDAVEDRIELLRNEINLLMNPIVVSYRDTIGQTEAGGGAARRMQWTYADTRTGGTFAAAYDAGLASLVLIDVPGSDIPAEVTSRLISGAAAGDLIIFSWWSLNSDAELAAALEVSTVSFGAPRDVVPATGATHDFFEGPQSVPVPLTNERDAGDNGDELTPTGGGFVAAAFDSADGAGAIAVSAGGTIIVNGFLPFDVGTVDTDGDMVPDMEELYENQFTYIVFP